MSKFVKILSLVMAMLMALACGAVADDAEAPEVTTINPGVLTVCTSADFAPYEFHIIDENGEDKIVGFDIALAQAIADYLGLTLEIKDMSFDSLIMEVVNGTADLSIAGFSPDPERAEVVDFSDIYYEGGQSFVVLAADADKYTSYADFAGLPVAAQTGSIQADLLAENAPDANAVLLANIGDIILEVLNGKAVGCFMETVVAESYIAQYPELMILWDVEYDVEGSAVVVGKGNQAMLDAVNAVIAAALEDGSMGEWVAEANALSTAAAE